MSSASVVQKQSLADILQNRCQACNFIEKRLQATQVFSYEIYKIFKNIFFYRTSLLWWLLLAVNNVNQWKPTLKVYYASKKEMSISYWTVLLRLVFLGFCEIFKNTFFPKTPPVAASEKLKAEAVVRRWSARKVFLEISLNSQERTCARVPFLQP